MGGVGGVNLLCKFDHVCTFAFFQEVHRLWRVLPHTLSFASFCGWRSKVNFLALYCFVWPELLLESSIHSYLKECSFVPTSVLTKYSSSRSFQVGLWILSRVPWSILPLTNCCVLLLSMRGGQGQCANVQDDSLLLFKLKSWDSNANTFIHWAVVLALSTRVCLTKGELVTAVLQNRV